MEINFDTIYSPLIDFHIHTNCSSANDEFEKMNLTPTELLKQVQDFVRLKKQQAIIAVTDHNNINAPTEIIKTMQANPEEYKGIKFVTGCEITASCESLGSYVNMEKQTKSILHSIHMLAYNFDINDKTMQLYSDLKSIQYGDYFIRNNIKYPFGTILIAGKKYLNSLGIPYQLSDFVGYEIIKGEPCDIKNFAINVQHFCDFCKRQLNLSPEIATRAQLYLLGLPQDYLAKRSNKKSKVVDLRDVRVSNVITNTKIDVMEMMSIVEKAGGVCSLAHPALIHVHESYTTYYRKHEALDPRRFIVQNFDYPVTKDNFDVWAVKKNECRFRMLNHVIQTLTFNAKNPITHEKLNGLVGIEGLHSNNMFPKLYEYLTEIAQRYNLYITGGSDKHGELYKEILSIGQIMPKHIEQVFPKLEKKDINFSIYYMPFANDIIENRKLERKPENDDVGLVCKAEGGFVYFDKIGIVEFIKAYANHDYFIKFDALGIDATEYKPKDIDMDNSNIL